MVAETSWRELCRFDDLLQARAVATSIAAMEFDVRLCDLDGAAGGDSQAAEAASASFIVEVDPADWPDLADVLDEIIDEQQEFDRALARRRAAEDNACIVIVITLTGAADILLLLGLLEL